MKVHQSAVQMHRTDLVHSDEFFLFKSAFYPSKMNADFWRVCMCVCVCVCMCVCVCVCVYARARASFCWHVFRKSCGIHVDCESSVKEKHLFV